MKNFKTLIIQPREYFKGVSDENNNREPIKLRNLFIILISLGIVNYTIQSNMFLDNMLEEFGVSGTSKAMVNIISYVSCIAFTLIGAMICVNILYLISKILLNLVEHKKINNSKYFKSVLYSRYIVVGIANTVLTILLSFIMADTNYLTIVGTINNIFIKLWATYNLYGIFKYYMKTNQLHKIFPIILYIFTLIGSIYTITSSMIINFMSI